MIIPIITGPTSSGKSNAVFNVGLKTNNIEIISADAFQVYKGLDIGTAKVSIEERQKVKHHLIDIILPSEYYSAGIFTNQAEKLIEEILNKGKIPIITGGTGLYIKSLMDGIFDCPEIDNNIRIDLQKRAEKDGLLSLYDELEKVDREYTLKINKYDKTKIIRALEIYHGLKIPFTEAHKKYNKKPKYQYTCAVLWKDRQALYEDINERTMKMWNAGWKKEVETLLQSGYGTFSPAFRAIGYKLIADYILNSNNKENEEDIINEIAKQTRHFAKRQYTWFKHQLQNQQNIAIYNDILLLENNLIDLINNKRGNL